MTLTQPEINALRESEANLLFIWIIKSKVTVSRSIGLSMRRKCRSRARSDLSGCWARLTTESRRKLMVVRQTSKHIGDSKNFNN